MILDAQGNTDFKFEFSDDLHGSLIETTDNKLRECYPIFLKDVGLDVPPVEWVYGTTLIRGMLSVLGGAGGVGKTSYVMKVLLSITLGRSLLCDDPDDPHHIIHEPQGKVWYYSLEDPMDMLQRRVKAELFHHNINPRLVWDKLALRSGRDAPLVVARVANGQIERCDIEPIVDFIIQHGFVAVAVDPFAISFEGADAENSSDFMKIVLDQWRLIAHKAHCAEWLIHHFKKGGLAGDADAFRGSSAIQNAARVMETLTTMTKEQAALLGVPEAERRQYARLENAKVNLSAAPADGEWYRFVGVPLRNPSPKYPKGDVIGVLTRWTPTENVLTWQQADQILTSIELGDTYPADPTKRYFFTSASQGSYWAGAVVMNSAQFNKEQAAQQIADWLSSGLLSKDEYKHPKHGKKTEKLVVDGAIKEAYLARLAGD